MIGWTMLHSWFKMALFYDVKGGKRLNISRLDFSNISHTITRSYLITMQLQLVTELIISSSNRIDFPQGISINAKLDDIYEYYVLGQVMKSL